MADIFKIFKNIGSGGQTLAIYLSTSEISAALSLKEDGKHNILKVLSCPVRLLGYGLSGQDSSRLSYILKDGFSKIFGEIRKISRKPKILIGLAVPFYKETKLSKRFERQIPQRTIDDAEIFSYLKSIEGDATHMHKDLLLMSSQLLNIKINGYKVADARGYKGKNIELEALFILSTPDLKECLEMAADKFFPHASFEYFADSEILWPALRGYVESSPLIFINIDGEISTFYWMDKRLTKFESVAFGIKTLARRLAAVLKTTPEEAESFINLYAAGKLEEKMNAKLDKVLNTAFADWLMNAEKIFADFDINPPSAGNIIISGSSAVKIFVNFTNVFMKTKYGINFDAKLMASDDVKEMFIPANAFSGKDPILPLLLIGKSQ